MTDSATTDFNTPGVDTKNPASPTTERLSEKTHAAVDKIAETMDKTEADLRAKANEADIKVREMGAEVQRQTEESLSEVRKYVAANPVKSAGIAFAAGAVLAALLRR
jgi:ElaB/YqjD/DUF883 family membrane-anchored ribosome-binding protein